MCRIAGIANKSLPMEAIEGMVSQMCELQTHGGPDDSGLYQCRESNLVLGHRRLALIDLSPAGHQPMTYDDRYVISFNGEIYNFPELKEELGQLGRKFHTHSDTEVILAAFAQWNTQSFAKLSGMFAFALYDTTERSLYLVRDPSGIKPLYYCSTSTSVEFASEMRAFNVTANKTANRSWPVFYLAYGHLPEPITTLEEVKPLHKGCFYKFNLATGTNCLQSFTHYSYSDTLQDVATSEAAIRLSLHNAVRRHLLSDAPIGVFLSGGIDSGIVTTVASQYQQEHLKTLSLYFREEDFSEKKHQDSIIQKLGCEYYQHLLSEEEFHDSFPGIIDAMDMPGSDGINTWFISKYARENGLKAVLSGIGGDELFGGYPSFSRINMALRLREIPSTMLQAASNYGGKTLKRLPYLSLEGMTGLYLFLRGIFTPAQIAKQLDASEKEIWGILKEQPVIPALCGISPKNMASWMEMNMYMQNQLLRDADVMSMAHGIEIRVPFLDPEVVRTSFSIDSSIKYHGALPKQILIDSFKTQLPEEVWNRKKMGFTFPFAQWMRDSLFVEETMQEGASSSRESYMQFKEGRLHWSHLMCLLIMKLKGV